ncbi:MAG: protein-export chaperone SecB [Pseudomonadota bacterium]
MTEPVAVPAPAPAAPATPHVVLQKIYLKDASLEMPNAPAIFTKQEQPAIDLQINTNAQNLGNDNFQVTLSVTITAKMAGGETAFLIEAHQCGIFAVRNFPNVDEVEAVLGTYCLQQMFPFARETVADLIQRAGFPPILLQPVNFDALYVEHRKQRAAQAAAPATTH